MLVSFFESIKYVGHLIPVSFLRIFLGYYYFQQFLLQFNSDFLQRPHLAEKIHETLKTTVQVPDWYKIFYYTYVIPHWETAAFIFLGIELAIAVSYIAGYVVRPMALIATVYSLNMIFISSPETESLYKTFLAIHFMMAWVGAGRCLGFDYYFFKRRRGFWW